jgi:hypothetical protein
MVPRTELAPEPFHDQEPERFHPVPDGFFGNPSGLPGIGGRITNRCPQQSLDYRRRGSLFSLMTKYRLTSSNILVNPYFSYLRLELTLINSVKYLSKGAIRMAGSLGALTNPSDQFWIIIHA